MYISEVLEYSSLAAVILQTPPQGGCCHPNVGLCEGRTIPFFAGEFIYYIGLTFNSSWRRWIVLHDQGRSYVRFVVESDIN